MSKTLILATAMVFSACQVFSQGGDLDAYYFNTQYRYLPKNKLPRQGATYTISESNASGVALGLDTNIKLNGFTKAPVGKVKLTVSYPWGMKYNDVQVETIKDPNSAGNLYTARRTIETDGRITVECQEIDYKRYDLSNFKRTFYTKQYNNEASARGEAASLASEWLKQGLDAFKQFAIAEASYYANVAFGYPVLNSKVKVYLPEQKKNPEYDNFKKNFEIIKAGFAKVTADSIPLTLEGALQPAIDYLKSIPVIYPEKDKGHKKIRYAAYYTLMKVYYQLEQYDKAAEYANLVIQNDYDPKDGKRFLSDIEDRKELLLRNGFKAIHFPLSGEDGYALFKTE